MSHEYDGTYLWFLVWFGSQGSIGLVNDLVAKQGTYLGWCWREYNLGEILGLGSLCYIEYLVPFEAKWKLVLIEMMVVWQDVVA